MSDLDLRDLDAFVAIARAKNFRRAATDQHVSVSSLSQRLRELEERLGVRLLNRTTRSVALTEAGELLLSRVAPAMADVNGALDEVRGLRGVPSGRNYRSILTAFSISCLAFLCRTTLRLYVDGQSN